MAKEFQRQYYTKCQACKDKDKCGWHEVTENGIILDCKAFYYVFCDLENKDRNPVGDPEEMRKFHKEAEKRVFVTPALVTNGILAVELALKYLNYKENRTFDCIHDISDLFYSLPEIHRNELESLLKKKTHQNDATLRTNLNQIRDFFVQWRYFFEQPAIGYSNFLLDSIHVICDYACEIYDNRMMTD